MRSPVSTKHAAVSARAAFDHAADAARGRRCWRRRPAASPAQPRRGQLDVTQGNVQPMPIALPDFVGGSAGDGDVARNVTQVITATSGAAACSRRSIRPPSSSASRDIDAVPRFADWRAINAQALVTGRVTRQADGRLKAEFRLWDVFAGQQLTGQQYFTAPDNWRRIAHIISDAIYRAPDRREGLFRQPRRVRRRDRPEGPPRQAARDHGPGRRQRALSHARRRSRADAALLAVDAGDHLHVLRPARAARLSCSTSKPGSARSSAISPA